MARLKIKDAPLLTTIVGDEKIPTGGKGDFSVTVDMLLSNFEGRLPFATKTELENVRQALDAKISNTKTTLELSISALDSRVTTSESNILGVRQDLTTHKADKANPHSVTKQQVGLGNVDNTSDVSKPLSTATQNSLNLKLDKQEAQDKIYKNGAALPYDSSITYNEGAVVVKDGELQQKSGLLWKPFNKSVKDIDVNLEDGTTQADFNKKISGDNGSSHINVKFDTIQNSIKRSVNDSLYSQIIDVTWFGAKGNWDKTNQIGNDDTIAVQNAIDYLASLPTRRGGGKRGLKFPKGSYLIKSITFPESLGFGLDLIGDGVKTTNLYFDHTTTSPAITCNIEYTQFRDITLIGSKDETWSQTRTVGFDAKLLNNYPDIDVTFQNCEIVLWNTFASIGGRGCVFNNCSIGLVTRVMNIVVADYVHSSDIEVMQSKYVTMRHYVFRGCRFDNASRAYSVSGQGDMINYINNLIFTDNDITSMDLIIDAPLATFINSNISNNTGLGSFATTIVNAKSLYSTNITGNVFSKLTTYAIAENSNVLSIEYGFNLSAPCQDLNISNNIIKGIRSALYRNTSTQPSQNINISNNILAEFGTWKGSNTTISLYIAYANCIGLNIHGNRFNSRTVGGSYYLFNDRGQQESKDVFYGSNTSPFIFIDELFSFTPKLYAGSSQSNTLTTAYCRYKTNNNHIHARYFVGGTVLGLPSDQITIDLPVLAIRDLSPYSNVYSGCGKVINAAGIRNIGSSFFDCQVNASNQRLELRKQKDMTISGITKSDIPSTFSLVIDVVYRFK